MWNIKAPASLHCLAEWTRSPGDQKASKQFPCSDFWRSSSWSPDGTSLLAVQDDNRAHIFTVPSEAAAAVLNGGDCATAPCAPLKPSLSVHTEASRGKPVCLWDANTGTVRCTYRTYDGADEVTACHSICFHQDCERIVGGLKGRLAIWQLTRPGRDHDTMPVELQGRQAGIVSAIDCAPQGDLLAAGTFNSLISIFDIRSFEQVSSMLGHAHGIIQLKFSRCGNFVYSRARKDPNITCWDIRYTGDRLYDMPVPGSLTNQRLWFDIEPCGRHLLAGGSTGQISIFDLSTGTLAETAVAAPDTLSSVSMHSTLPLVATTSGHRRFWEEDDGDWDDGALVHGCNSLRIWHLQSTADSDEQEQQHASVPDT